MKFVTTGVTTGTAIRKINNVILKEGSRHHSFHGKLWKTKENRDKASLRKSDYESGSRLRVGKVLAPHDARPKTVPLTK